ncbi:unnamed protein product [Prorocentrum cordatum]|uniref:Uncharacterized protein n=1 Tax=Prorocentrum cordatum TaxID=2364126 RepID=A0ABN9UV63_9DINO|nr:unnamed protein product [Polarella glacialis]
MAPMSYSPGLHIILALGILMLSLAAHLYAKPFKKEKNMLNNVEGASLTVLNVALLLAMYITTDIWSATTASKQVATMLAGSLLIGWFWVLIGLLIQAKLAEMRERRAPTSSWRRRAPRRRSGPRLLPAAAGRRRRRAARRPRRRRTRRRTREEVSAQQAVDLGLALQ